MAQQKIPIAIAHGDGIGPEIMNATLHILEVAGAALEKHVIEIGEKVYLKGHPTGIEPQVWDILRQTKAFLKAPVTTPQGGGFKSLNVTIRTTLGLFANVRPCVSYYPFVETKHPEMDVTIIRENEEDLYVGIEHQQTPEVCQALKLITRPGSEKIIRYAFELARHYERKKVTCFMKDNILKHSDGLFHQVFKEVSKEYSDILNEHWIVDIGMAKLADTPEIFDVIVLPNLYGDILSDIAAQISGSVGLAGSANIGEKAAMFEAIHGSAPRRAGQNVANPSGLLLASVMMLVHIGLPDIATTIHNGWLRTIEEGIHTYDIFKEGISKQKVGTKEFAQAVVKNLGKKPNQLKPMVYKKETSPLPKKKTSTPVVRKNLIGVDIFIQASPPMQTFFSKLSHISIGPLHLSMITNRGVRVWPGGQPETFCVDHWRCRFISKDSRTISQNDIIQLQQAIDHVGIEMIKTENLYLFNNQPAFSQAEG